MTARGIRGEIARGKNLQRLRLLDAATIKVAVSEEKYADPA